MNVSKYLNNIIPCHCIHFKLHLQCPNSTPWGVFLAKLLNMSVDKHTHNIHILPGPHLYSWVGIKKWIKCLAERQKQTEAMMGIELGPQRREASTVMPYIRIVVLLVVVVSMFIDKFKFTSLYVFCSCSFSSQTFCVEVLIVTSSIYLFHSDGVRKCHIPSTRWHYTKHWRDEGMVGGGRSTQWNRWRHHQTLHLKRASGLRAVGPTVKLRVWNFLIVYLCFVFLTEGLIDSVTLLAWYSQKGTNLKQCLSLEC